MMNYLLIILSNFYVKKSFKNYYQVKKSNFKIIVIKNTLYS